MVQLSFFSFTNFVRRLPFYLIVLVCIEVSAFGQRGRGPVASSLGGAGVASLQAVEGAFFNPAAIASAENNHVSIHGSQEELNGVDYKDWGFYAIDSGSGSIAKGAFSYQKSEQDGPGLRSSTSRWEISGAKYLIPGLALGTAFTKQTDRDLINETEKVEYNLDLGALYNFDPSLSAGLLLENAFTGKDDRQQPLFTAGMEYRLGSVFRYLAETNKVFKADSQWNYAVGVELKATDSTSYRLGYLGDKENNRNYYTGGFSWQGPRLGIYYAFQSGVGDSAETLHSLDFRVFF